MAKEYMTMDEYAATLVGGNMKAKGMARGGKVRMKAGGLCQEGKGRQGRRRQSWHDEEEGLRQRRQGRKDGWWRHDEEEGLCQGRQGKVTCLIFKAIFRTSSVGCGRNTPVII